MLDVSKLLKKGYYMEIEDVKNYKKRPKSPRRSLKTIMILLVIALFVFGVFLVIDYFNLGDLGKMWQDLGFDSNEVKVEYETDPDADNLDQVDYVGGDVQTIEKDDDIIDIALVGVDNRNPEKFTGRSDVLMIVRIDKKNNDIKLASFMRDTLVEIEGHNYNRINTAYHFGSVDLLYDTMKKNFGITPDHYMVVNFFGMEDIINAMGGVDIEIESKELKYLNGSIDETNAIDSSGKASHINSAGMHHLNGRQAVAYMRIRKIGGDAARVGRQQIVLNALFESARTMGVGQIPETIEALSQYVRTDIPITSMVSIGTSLLDMGTSGLQKFTYPDKYKVGGYKGMSIVQPADFDEEMSKLKGFFEN